MNHFRHPDLGNQEITVSVAADQGGAGNMAIGAQGQQLALGNVEGAVQGPAAAGMPASAGAGVGEESVALKSVREEKEEHPGTLCFAVVLVDVLWFLRYVSISGCEMQQSVTRWTAVARIKCRAPLFFQPQIFSPTL